MLDWWCHSHTYTHTKQSLHAIASAVMRTQQIKGRSLSLPGYLCTKQVLGPVQDVTSWSLARNFAGALAMITTGGVNNCIEHMGRTWPTSVKKTHTCTHEMLHLIAFHCAIMKTWHWLPDIRPARLYCDQTKCLLQCIQMLIFHLVVNCTHLKTIWSALWCCPNSTVELRLFETLLKSQTWKSSLFFFFLFFPLSLPFLPL